MRFDIFHSIGRIDSVTPGVPDAEIFRRFFLQVQAAEDLGYGTIWVAESHFSTEVQKKNPEAVVPHYSGEIGLSADGFQLAAAIFERTRRIGFGTAIMNIVGGNGGPIAAADRVRILAMLNALRANPRQLDIGIASGRFPYINRPFGIVPRNDEERKNWSAYQRVIFLEALEIFLRLSGGETLSSGMTENWTIADKGELIPASRGSDAAGIPYAKRWMFEPLKLVPELPATSHLPKFVLGSSDPNSRLLGAKYADLDIFNLSFTDPATIDRMHVDLTHQYEKNGYRWHRGRMPRTVLVFVDREIEIAQARASACFDVYIEAMRGTVAMPDKAVLMERALIGDPATVVEQLAPGARHGFHPDDRLMLWFEFAQGGNDAIVQQMQLFAERVIPHVNAGDAGSRNTRLNRG